MVEIVRLPYGADPPADARFRAVRWRTGRTRRIGGPTGRWTYHTPEHLFDKTITEQIEAAERLGLSKLYVIGPP